MSQNSTRRGFLSFAAAFAASIPALLGGKLPGEEPEKPAVKAVEKIVYVDKTPPPPPPRVRPDLSHLRPAVFTRAYNRIEIWNTLTNEQVWVKNEFEIHFMCTGCSDEQWEDICDRISLDIGMNVNETRFSNFIYSGKRFDDGTEPKRQSRLT